MEDPGNKDREDYEEVDLNMDSKQWKLGLMVEPLILGGSLRGQGSSSGLREQLGSLQPTWAAPPALRWGGLVLPLLVRRQLAGAKASVVDMWPTFRDILEYEILSVPSYFKNISVTLDLRTKSS